MEGIRNFEKNILIEIDFVEKVTRIREEFIRIDSDNVLKCDQKTFTAMVDPKYNMKQEGGKEYTISKSFNNYTIELAIDKLSGAGLLFYIYIYENDQLQDIGFSQYGEVLNDIPYDNVRIEKTNRTFGYNNVAEMKDYLNQMIGLWEEFTDKYIEKLKLGIEPPNTPYEDD